MPTYSQELIHSLRKWANNRYVFVIPNVVVLDKMRLRFYKNSGEKSRNIIMKCPECINSTWRALRDPHVFQSGTHFNNDISAAIQIRWKFHFTLASILVQWSLQNFVHGTTALLSWHVQQYFAILWPTKELQQGEFPSNLNCGQQIISETEARSALCHQNAVISWLRWRKYTSRIYIVHSKVIISDKCDLCVNFNYHFATQSISCT